MGETAGNGPAAVFGHVVTTGPTVPGTHDALAIGLLERTCSVQVVLM